MELGRRWSLGGAVSGLLFSAVAVAAVTGAIFGLRTFTPVLSLGVLYVFAVLPVAVGWGLAYAVPVSITSMLAFNFFFLRPCTRLRCKTARTGLPSPCIS